MKNFSNNDQNVTAKNISVLANKQIAEDLEKLIRSLNI